MFDLCKTLRLFVTLFACFEPFVVFGRPRRAL